MQKCQDMTSIIQEGRKLPEARILPESKISKKEYNKLRGKTPTDSLRDYVNPDFDNSIYGKLDEALHQTITDRLEVDHIVSMKIITHMDGFHKLTYDQKLAVLNNEKNFIGLTKTANTSKGRKSFEEWLTYKTGNIQVDPIFREKMIEVEEMLKRILQKQIDDFNKLNLERR